MKTKFVIEAYCFLKNSRLLSFATNSYNKSHPIQSYFAAKVGLPNKIYLHAEIAALLKTKGKNVYSIHVIRKDAKGNLANAKPCPICMEAIKAYGIKKIFFSNAKGEIESWICS